LLLGSAINAITKTNTRSKLDVSHYSDWQVPITLKIIADKLFAWLDQFLVRIWASFAEEQLSNLMNGSQCDCSVQVPGLLLELFKIPHFYLKLKPGAMLESIRSDALLPIHGVCGGDALFDTRR